MNFMSVYLKVVNHSMLVLRSLQNSITYLSEIWDPGSTQRWTHCTFLWNFSEIWRKSGNNTRWNIASGLFWCILLWCCMSSLSHNLNNCLPCPITCLPVSPFSWSSDVTSVHTAVLRILPVLLGDDPEEFYRMCFVSNVNVSAFFNCFFKSMRVYIRILSVLRVRTH